jgi:hypothetical protein
MRVSIPRLARIIPRSTLSETPRARLYGLPESDAPRAPTLMEALQARKAAAGADYPSNIRLEEPIDKQALKNILKGTRRELKGLVKER